MLAAWACDHRERAQSQNVIAEHKVKALYRKVCVSKENLFVFF